MSTIAQAFRNRRDFNRNQRVISRAIRNATTPAMRDELIVMSQRDEAIGR